MYFLKSKQTHKNENIWHWTVLGQWFIFILFIKYPKFSPLLPLLLDLWWFGCLCPSASCSTGGPCKHGTHVQTAGWKTLPVLEWTGSESHSTWKREEELGEEDKVSHIRGLRISCLSRVGQRKIASFPCVFLCVGCGSGHTSSSSGECEKLRAVLNERPVWFSNGTDQLSCPPLCSAPSGLGSGDAHLFRAGWESCRPRAQTQLAVQLSPLVSSWDRFLSSSSLPDIRWSFAWLGVCCSLNVLFWNNFEAYKDVVEIVESSRVSFTQHGSVFGRE